MTKKYLTDDEFVLPDAMAELELLADRLWMDYFKPDEPPTKEVRAELMRMYNKVADTVNKKAGSVRLIKITPSMRWEPKSENATKALRPKAELKTTPPADGEPIKKTGIVQQILSQWKAGHSKKEIIAMGFKKNTVNNQVRDFIKENPSLHTDGKYTGGKQ